MVFIATRLVSLRDHGFPNAKCWKESMFSGASARNALYPWEELSRGNMAKFTSDFVVSVLLV